MTPHPAPRRISLPSNLGGVANIDTEGNIEFDRTRIRSVGVGNLAEVVNHRIVAIADSISHYVRFHNGGELYYVFNARGQLVDLTAKKVRITVAADASYLFHAL
jgi:hypothetical protein